MLIYNDLRVYQQTLIINFNIYSENYFYIPMNISKHILFNH